MNFLIVAVIVLPPVGFFIGYASGLRRAPVIESEEAARLRATNACRGEIARLTKGLEEAKSSFSRIRVAEAMDGTPDTIVRRCMGEARLGFIAARSALQGGRS